VWEDRVFLITCDEPAQTRLLVCLDRKTGETLWQRVVLKAPLENLHQLNSRASSTPATDGRLVYVSFLEPDGSQVQYQNQAGRHQLMLSGNKCIASYDPRTGERQWLIDGPTEQFVASMVMSGDLLFMTAGFPDHHILAIRPDGAGNVTDSHIVWRTTESCSYV